jgi:pimeloyl-ACP methyl ester carboxylesterase
MKILMIAGFGDNASMFEPLLATELAEANELIPLDLPGFGAPCLSSATSLSALGEWVAQQASEHGAIGVMAHSVASIIASMAASAPESQIKQIISLEGNLTAEDAYFSGRAAEFDDPTSFREWFLPRLVAKAANDPILARYVEAVETADPQALWELGCDAHRFSQSEHPGEWLERSAAVTYVVNRANCARASMQWLDQSGLDVVELAGASHWPTIDQPEQLAGALIHTLGSTR